MNDKIAIKIERPNLTSSLITNESYYTRILNDDHHLTYVPKYYGDNFHNKRNYIIIEYIDSSIDSYLKLPKNHPGKLSLVSICQQMFRCLQGLHETHHLHRDVKPENFMINSKDNKVKLIDLGLLINFMPDGVHRPMGRYTF
jgi:serine/threonine protein kinase